MTERSSIFDMIGPVMIGPSSSHTAGVARIGRLAQRLFGSVPKQATITFYNSFSRTYEGHGSDRAIVAGLLGFSPDDTKIRESFSHAASAGLDYQFKAVFNASTLHPNSVRVLMESGEQRMTVLGVSRGGGLISMVEIDGFSCNFDGNAHTLVVTALDVHGSIGFITSILAREDCNIATMTVNRSAKNDIAKMVMEMDSPVRPLTLDYLRSLTWVKDVLYIEPVND